MSKWYLYEGIFALAALIILSICSGFQQYYLLREKYTITRLRYHSGDEKMLDEMGKMIRRFYLIFRFLDNIKTLTAIVMGEIFSKLLERVTIFEWMFFILLLLVIYWIISKGIFYLKQGVGFFHVPKNSISWDSIGYWWVKFGFLILALLMLFYFNQVKENKHENNSKNELNLISFFHSASGTE